MTDSDRACLLQQYLTALRDHGAELTGVDDLGSDDQPVVMIAGLGYVLMTVTSDAPGLWRLDQALVNTVQQRAGAAGAGSWFVLLIERRDGRGANGYLLKDFSSPPVKRTIDSEDGCLVIREKRHLDSLRLILSTDKQAELLLRQRTSTATGTQDPV